MLCPCRKIAIGKNSSCRITSAGDILIADGIGGAVAVQPAGGIVQRIIYSAPSGAALASAAPWSGRRLEEGADEAEGTPEVDEESDTEIAQTEADLIALLSSLAFAYAPPVRPRRLL